MWSELQYMWPLEEQKKTTYFLTRREYDMSVKRHSVLELNCLTKIYSVFCFWNFCHVFVLTAWYLTASAVWICGKPVDISLWFWGFSVWESRDSGVTEDKGPVVEGDVRSRSDTANITQNLPKLGLGFSSSFSQDYRGQREEWKQRWALFSVPHSWIHTQQLLQSEICQDDIITWSPVYYYKTPVITDLPTKCVQMWDTEKKKVF